MSEQNPALNLRTVKLIEVVPKFDRWLVVLHYRDEVKPDSHILNAYQFKWRAKREAISVAKFQAQQQGFPVQVHFKTRDGKIPKGHHGTATYGPDPKKYKG